jgi:membrane-associated protein
MATGDTPPARAGVAPLPWKGKAEREDRIIIALIGFSALLSFALLPLVPALVASHPELLELIRGSTASIINMGARARIGETSIVAAVLFGVPSLMMFDWVYWWAGRRWGRNVIGLFLGNHPKAAKRTERLERLILRYGWVAIVIAYFQPVPNVLIYAAAGWTGMRLRTFLLLDLIGSLLWIALCVGLGYAIGQSAVDIAKGVSHYALYLTIALVVAILARQAWTANRGSSPTPRPD